jgi:CspA family cold shock protein
VKREQYGPVVGIVAMWNDEEGWGAVASAAVEGAVWTHYSKVVSDGYRTLTPGDSVSFTDETPGQDGYPHRALSVERVAH